MVSWYVVVGVWVFGWFGGGCVLLSDAGGAVGVLGWAEDRADGFGGVSVMEMAWVCCKGSLAALGVAAAVEAVVRVLRLLVV